jgi:hypothetical protein
MAYYLIGCVHFTLKQFRKAEKIFKACLAILDQLATPGISYFPLVRLISSPFL